MRTRLIVGLLVWLSVVAPFESVRATQTPSVFVQKDVKWRTSPRGYETGFGSVVAVDQDHKFLKLFAQLYRERKTRVVTVDLKSGYLVSAGTWSPKGDGAIEVRSRAVDSFKVFQKGGDSASAESAEVWTISGDSFGPLRRTLVHDKEVFEPESRFHSGDLIDRFWQRFAAAK